ncbi:helix-turn-helix domain-containing protein [Laspinema olomoucense]|uniref:Helix-turn-helix domain-containing protein n=1 Tax=Laspinema olomoucense D3b TaxID=2953688 RepID=A0ABT2N6E6_9CYAN|nr:MULTISPECIES: helix-turn-helix transcriptional regulator [unclassified Laspinema]MCT7975008.1 helix-turn-helix domain-containing protein [Laspinema sp. D3d]MCT7978265.1 helix-turn-helix domain-containing protein [Laspinema sp. D3b]MCT7996677.1 helix-turn-helix domain-containing protein [Laspinema sp. D3c]
MEKSIFTQEYLLFLGQLRRARKAAGMTQEQVAGRLRQTQSFVSKCERGERRIDVIELRAYCRAIGISFIEFIEQVESTIETQEN